MSRRDEAAAMLKAGRTELERARLDLERIEKAVQTGSVSQQELTRARAAYDIAQAQVMGYEAMLQKAELDLSYTEIRSPISGRIGRRLVDAGNLVGSGDRTVLTTVMQTQPIYVFFHIGEHLLKGDFLRQLQGGAGVEPLRSL
jgi:RND family efflux transporter MFP subunit